MDPQKTVRMVVHFWLVVGVFACHSASQSPEPSNAISVPDACTRACAHLVTLQCKLVSEADIDAGALTCADACRKAVLSKQSGIDPQCISGAPDIVTLSRTCHVRCIE